MEASEMDKPSLMQKLRMHYNERDFKPKDNAADKWGIVTFLIFTPTLLLTEIYIVIPELERYSSNKGFYLDCYWWFMFIHAVSNWICIVKNSRKSHVTPEHAKFKSESCSQENVLPSNNTTSAINDWKYCLHCQHEAPPRSHHCKICRRCVLKRDQHCFFAGSCIGFHSQRYFVVCMFYTMLGSLTAVIMNFCFLNRNMEFWSEKFVYYLPPIAIYGVLNGYMRLSELLILIETWFCFVTLSGSAMFFFWQMFIIYRGQTSNEAWKHIHRYRVEPIHNFQSVFGSFWILNFIIPFLPTTQEGKGFEWEKNKRIKGQ